MIEQSLARSIAAAAVLVAGAVFITAPAAANNEELAKKNNCLACHTVDTKLIGPPYKEVAAKYKSDPAAAAALVEKVKKGSSGVWGQIPMPPNTTVSDADAKALVDWILTL
jgi:cytochrome c